MPPPVEKPQTDTVRERVNEPASMSNKTPQKSPAIRAGGASGPALTYLPSVTSAKMPGTGPLLAIGSGVQQQASPSPTPSINFYPDEDFISQFRSKGLAEINLALQTKPLDVNRLNTAVAHEIAVTSCYTLNDKVNGLHLRSCMVVYMASDIARRGEALIRRYDDNQAIVNAVESHRQNTVLNDFSNALMVLLRNPDIRSYDDFTRFLKQNPGLESIFADVMIWVGIHDHEIRSLNRDPSRNQPHAIFERLKLVQGTILDGERKNQRIGAYAYAYLLAGCFDYSYSDDNYSKDPYGKHAEVGQLLFSKMPQEDINELWHGLGMERNNDAFQKASELIRRYYAWGGT